MDKKALLTLLLIGFMAVGMVSVAFAHTVEVTIGTPSNSNGDLGTTSGSYWVGQFPITITYNNGTQKTVEVYCLNYDNTVYEGSTYQASIVNANNTAQWRAISYILSWYAATSNNNTAASVAQVAIWRTLGGYNPSEFNLDQSIETQATNIAAAANGKDVVRQGDHLTWITPTKGNTTAMPGQSVTFQLQLTNSTGYPRPNVQIDFNATLQSSGSSSLLDSTYVSAMQVITDSNGKAQITVTVPANAPLGSTIKVQASTQSVWPQEYVDLTNYTSSAQNFVGATPSYTLTTSTNLSISGFVLVAPESAIGALSAILASAAAVVVYNKYKRVK